MTDKQEAIDLLKATGQGCLINCNLELGVGVKELPDGRASIFVNKDLPTEGYDGPALRKHLEEIAVAWLERVAPHRLKDGQS